MYHIIYIIVITLCHCHSGLWHRRTGATLHSRYEHVAVVWCPVQALLKLCRFRNHHPAFQGDVFVDGSTPDHLLVSTCCNLQARTLTDIHNRWCGFAYSLV